MPLEDDEDRLDTFYNDESPRHRMSMLHGYSPGRCVSCIQYVSDIDMCPIHHGYISLESKFLLFTHDER